MAGLLLSGPAGGGKSQVAARARADINGPSILVDFQSTYANILGLERLASGRYPPRLPQDEFAIPMVEYLRRTMISAALTRDVYIFLTNSDGSPARRQELLGLLGSGATERIVDPGLDVVTRRLSINGELSQDCSRAIDRWFGRL